MPSSIFFIAIAFLLLLLPSLSVSEKCHPNDKNALLKIKKSLNNPYVLTSWDPTTDCCSWYVVACHPTTHRIVQLHLSSAALTGPIPAAISDLPHLELLVLKKLSLSGQIPPSITKLTNLRHLELSWNHLSGHIPPFLSRLKHLYYLDLSFNNFTGTIPASLSLLPRLRDLHLDRNKLDGSIPVALGKFARNAPNLYLSHNLLSGEVPRSLGDLNSGHLDLSRNRLRGDASFLFGAKKTLYFLDLSRNMLEFDLSKVEIPDSMTWLDLNHNRITGKLPEKLAEMANMQVVNVSYNRLCGRIPVAGGRLQKMEYTSFFHNSCLCGAPLPPCK